MAVNINLEREIYVRCVQEQPPSSKTIKMKVGVSGAMHIEFEYSRSTFVLL